MKKESLKEKATAVAKNCKQSRELLIQGEIENNNQIDKTSYYELPCGKFLEDYIYACKLDFAAGSAVKYLWRAGRKSWEAYDKDVAKAVHYIKFMAQREIEKKKLYRGEGWVTDEIVEAEEAQIFETVKSLCLGAAMWDGSTHL